MKLIGYMRVSTEDQLRASAQSLERVQPTELRRYCKQHRHTLVEILKDEGVSAGIPLHRRPQGAVLLARLAAGAADGVIVLSHDRLFRDGIDALTVAAALKRRGQTIVSIREPIDLTTRHGWLSFGIQALMAEHERGADIERAEETTRALLREGYAYGPVPYGCVRVDTETPTRTEKRLYREPASWRVREQIVFWHLQDVSLRGIAKRLHMMAIPAPNGGERWHVNTIRNIVETHSELKHIPVRDVRTETLVSDAAAAAVEELCPDITPTKH